MSEQRDLTICTVSFGSRALLDLNRDLTLRLNGLTHIRWVVAENSPGRSAQRLSENDTRFTVIPGAGFEQRPHESGSYHHGNGMNSTLEHIDTRYALFLDPDFFIIRKEWITDVLIHMSANRVSLFGAPWHPRWYRKIRYFPCAHCLFIDLAQIPRESLDFVPGYEGVPPYEVDWNPVGKTAKALRWSLRILDPIKFRKRRFIGASRDVGWRIYDRFFADPQVKSECLQPVFHPQMHPLKRLIERCLPERYSLVPKGRDYSTERGFKERGLPDLDGLAWEEFVWRDEPFGFHIRSTPKSSSGEVMDLHLSRLKDLLAAWPPVQSADQISQRSAVQ